MTPSAAMTLTAENVSGDSPRAVDRPKAPLGLAMALYGLVMGLLWTDIIRVALDDIEVARVRAERHPDNPF